MTSNGGNGTSSRLTTKRNFTTFRSTIIRLSVDERPALGCRVLALGYEGEREELQSKAKSVC